MPQSAPAALAILGPTASGKTALALALATSLPVEIISLDSALVYRGMDIGTAKPDAAERAAVPHHLIDLISPLENYSAAQFVADCARTVAAVHRRGRLPLIVGGTMMYYHALAQGLNRLPEADAALRAQLQQLKQQQGLAALYSQLKAVDPDTALRLAPGDSQRIERALEVWLLTGRPLSHHLAEPAAHTPPLRLHTVALIPAERSRLHAQIARRFAQMLDQGLPEEVARLQSDYPGLHADMPSMRCVGYRQTWDYLAGRYDRQELYQRGTAATRQLAKRQLTWLRRLPADTVLDPDAGTTALLPALKAACTHHFDRHC